MSVAVLDVGKTNVKVVLFDGDGAIIAERSRANAALPADARWPYPRLDVDTIWTFLLSSLAELDAVAPIETVSISAHGAAGVMVDESSPSPPPMDYEFDGFGALDAEYDAIRPPFSETLSPRAPRGLNLGRSVYFYERRYPEAFARARAFLMYPQYWLWRLTGVLASEVTSLACHADLWRPREARLSSLVEARGWTRLFPPLRNAWDAFPILPEVAARAQVSSSVRVLTGGHDSNLSLAPHIVARESPFSVVSTGTWVILMAVGGVAQLDPAWDMLANVDVTGRLTPTARFMGGREFAFLAGEPPAPIGPEDVAAIVASGALPLPAFSDQGGPFWNRSGAIEGPAPQTAAGLTALATLYVALMTKLMLDKLDAPGDWIVEGGFAKTPAFAGVLAALDPHRRVLVAASSGAAEGAALLARWRQKPRVEAREATAWEIPGLATYAAQWRAKLFK